MSEQEATPEKGPRQLRIHTQYLIAVTRLAKPMGWDVGDPINLDQTRSGKITIENLADPEVIATRKEEYAKAQAKKEALYKAKKEKKAAEAKAVKEAKDEAAAAEAEEAEVEPTPEG